MGVAQAQTDPKGDHTKTDIQIRVRDLNRCQGFCGQSSLKVRFL